MTWYFLMGLFWGCIKEAVGQRVTAPVRVGGWLGMVASQPGKGGGRVLLAFKVDPSKRKSIGQVNPNCREMELLRAGPHK
jgi:hypothetical protein